jgi:hypothetical protein
MAVRKYNSFDDTTQHICRVGQLLREICQQLAERGVYHDSSKLGPAEKPYFDALGESLKGVKYGSPEYQAALARLRPALVHHYAHNRHHPESRKGGIGAMTLIDLLELLADWKAAAERHGRRDCNLAHSLRVNRKRFTIPAPIYRQLVNTAKELGWLEPKPTRRR